nr:SMP-30/gluconolactonase/LRE family protein [Kutzneria albida]
MDRPRLLPVTGVGTEDVVLDHEGHVVTGVADGGILRVSPDGRTVTRVAETGGRPLGVELLADGRLLVCDAYRGLLAVDPVGGGVEVLAAGAERVAGKPLVVCNNAAVGSDGTIYFTDSSQRFGLEHYTADLLEHSGTGRLLRRDASGEVTELLGGLQFANGVALAQDESYVVVAETGAYRLRRVWLTGPRTGQDEVLAENLPGFPDNLSTGTGGRIWVALASPRNPALDWVAPKHPVLRKGIWALPPALLTRLEIRTSWVLAVDGTGQVVCDLQGDGSRFHMVTGMREHEGKLYLGSLRERAVAVIDLS